VLLLLQLRLEINFSVLGEIFVLGRASAALSRLGDSEVTELIAGVLSNLVEGEILQMREPRS
jgi:hexaprenyl-diphosphate synthase